MKTLGQIAHEAGAKAGSWARRWEDMSQSQREEWEVLANAVADVECEVCASVVDEFKFWVGRQAKHEIATAIRMRKVARNITCAGRHSWKCQTKTPNV